MSFHCVKLKKIPHKKFRVHQKYYLNYDVVESYDIFDPVQAAYEFYDDWIKSGGVDLHLGANRLTDRQLFWVAAAKVDFRKYHSQDQEDDHFNERFSSRPGFSDAFNCKK